MVTYETINGVTYVYCDDMLVGAIDTNSNVY